MAIEFDCPSCTATIRVPDAYGGKQGRCPKCNTHLLVPMVVRPGSTTVPESSAAPVTSSTPLVPDPSFPPPDVFSVKPVKSPSISRRRPGRRRPSRALVIGMPVLCFLVLLAAIFFSVTGSLPELNGEFATKRLETNTLPGVTIPWSDSGLAPEDQKMLQAFLETTPETLASDVMTCRLIGTPEGIEVRMTAGPTSDWFAVNTTSSKPLALWLKRERQSLNSKRMSILHSSVQAYCKDKLAQINGDVIGIDPVTIRDNVGINASGDALSFAVVAVTGSRQIRCAYEDNAGTLYFCLPKATQSFQIVGRTLADNTKPFAGEFTAVVGEISRPSAEPDTTEKKSPDPSADTMPAPGPDSAEEGSPKMDSKEKMDAPSEGDDEGEMMNDSESDMQQKTGMGMDSDKPAKKSGAKMMGDEMMDGEMMDGEMKPKM